MSTFTIVYVIIKLYKDSKLVTVERRLKISKRLKLFTVLLIMYAVSHMIHATPGGYTSPDIIAVDVYYNGELVEYELSPVIINGRTYIPLHESAEIVDFEFLYDNFEPCLYAKITMPEEDATKIKELFTDINEETDETGKQMYNRILGNLNTWFDWWDLKELPDNAEVFE